MSLTLIGLGVTEKDVTLAAAEKISKAEVVLLKTDMTANYPFFTERGIKVSTMDRLYGKSRNFDTLAKNVAAEVIAAAKDKEAVYCVDGSVLEDNACKLILAKAKGTEVISGVSKVSSALEKLGISGGYSAVSAYDLGDFYLSGGTLCVYDIDSEPLAGEVKLRLMEEYGDECPCVAFYGDKTEKILLYEADRLLGYSFFVRGIVVKGAGIASKLGFPSANINYPDDKVQLPEGVYFVQIKTGGSVYNGVLNRGISPDINNVPSMKTEVHIIGFNGDIYGKNIEISFITKIRNQIKFENTEKLKVQILRDTAFTYIYSKFMNRHFSLSDSRF